MKTLSSIWICMLLSTLLFAQYREEGSIRVIQDPEIDLLVRKHIQLNERIGGVPGYRIQIFFDSGTHSKTNATMVCEEFRMKFPGTDIYLSFISPNYKVRVGDFRTRFDAFKFLHKILSDYPNAYIVEDQINLPQVD